MWIFRPSQTEHKVRLVHTSRLMTHVVWDVDTGWLPTALSTHVGGVQSERMLILWTKMQEQTTFFQTAQALVSRVQP